MMKSLFLTISLFLIHTVATAQFRADQPSALRYTGNVLKPAAELRQSQFLGIQNFEMRHSYEMSFTNMGGQTGNLNMYTNTMLFQFNPRLTGRVDVAFAHSNFGNNPMMSGMGGPQVFLRNAELSYQISEKSSIHFSFQQLPGSMMMDPFNPMWGSMGMMSPGRFQNRNAPFGAF